jgi:hypothetical protein
MRPRGKRWLVAIVVVCTAASAVEAAPRESADAPTAVAQVLPRGYRLLLTEQSHHGTVHVARYGKPGIEEGDAPLTVTSFRGGDDPPAGAGDRHATVRGHPAILRTLTDEERAYAKELTWRERPDLVVAVELPLPARKLARVAEGVRVIDQPAWALLHEQTSYAALIGHVSPSLERVRVLRGRVAGRTWTLSALVPPHFPLSRDDLRVSCHELAFRGRRGHGTDCGAIPNWQRVGGTIFVFGAVGRPLRRVRIRSWQGSGLDLTIRTRAARRGPRVRYYATPLPEGTCAVSVDGAVTGPIRGPDHRRCAR